MANHPIKRARDQVAAGKEQAARRAILEDLFYDFHASRAQVYKANFFRGIFFGFGSVLGGTVLIALLVWGLSFFVNLPGIGNSIKQVTQTLEQRNK